MSNGVLQCDIIMLQNYMLMILQQQRALFVLNPIHHLNYQGIFTQLPISRIKLILFWGNHRKEKNSYMQKTSAFSHSLLSILKDWFQSLD